MNMRNLKYFIFILIITNLTPSFSQDFHLGAKYGIGSAGYTRQSDNFKTDHYSFNKGALTFEYSPFLSHLFIGSGVEYQISDLGNTLSVPLTFRLAFRKKVRPFVECGGYYNYNLDDNDDLYTIKNDLGAKVGCGLLIHMGKRWRFDAGYFHRFGFTAGLKEEILLPLEQIQLENYRLNEGSFEFCIKYRF